MSRRHRFSWSDLPSDLVYKIANVSDSRLDLLRCRAVCTSWRSAIPPPPKTRIPNLSIPVPIDPNSPHLNRGQFELIESYVYIFEPLTNSSNTRKETWLVRVVEDSESGNVKLKDPLSIFPVKTVGLPKSLNLLDYRVREICKGYDLICVNKDKVPHTKTYMKQVAVSTSFDKNGADGFAVMVMYDYGRLALWRMGDDKWTLIKNNRKRSWYLTIAYYNGKFFAVDKKGLTVTIDPTSLKVKRVTPAKNRSRLRRSDKFQFLVKSSEDLFLIEKDTYNLNEIGEDDDHLYFSIFKLSKEKRDWIEVDGLENLALFLGDSCSFFVSAEDLGGFRSNSICYPHDLFFNTGDNNYPGSHDGIFDMKYGDRHGESGDLRCFPSCAKLFWPPPTWIKNNPSVSPQLMNAG